MLFLPLLSSTPHFSLEVKEVRCQLGKGTARSSSVWLSGELPGTHVRRCVKAFWEVRLLMRCGALRCHF